MKKLIFLFCIFSTLHSEDIQLRYIKMGTELGVGYRWHRKNGVDLSVNLTTLLVWNYFSAKALYLRFPLYEEHRFLYWGAGAGCVYEVDFGGERFFPSFESAVGYEFGTDKKIKYFLQLGLSVPLSRYSFPVIPSLSFGIGF